MTAVERTPIRVALIVTLLLAVVLGQNLADSLAPSGTSAQTGRLVGRAGFAYLSGIRTFAAAVLWNRLEPQFDMYYHERGLAENTQLIPAMWMVVTLDPQFEQAYYSAPWIIARHGDPETALDVARQGIENNPTSGLLRSSYIQLLLLGDKEKHVQEAVAQADAGTAPGTVWNNDNDRFEGYAVFETVYLLAGLTQKADAARAVKNSLPISGEGESLGGAGHDHDGDGKPDH